MFKNLINECCNWECALCNNVWNMTLHIITKLLYIHIAHSEREDSIEVDE